MELKVVKEDEKTLVLELKGQNTTLTSLIKDELWNDKNVSEAAQIKEHPYLANPKIFVKVSSGTTITALSKAAKRVEKHAAEFSEEFKRALKKS